MMCDLENSYSDENGMLNEECQKALQNVDVKECSLQDCPGMEIETYTLLLQCLYSQRKGNCLLYLPYLP